MASRSLTIQCFPVELLTEIFEYQVEKKEVLAISQVCARWRQIAHNCPRLWSAVEVDVERPSTDSAYVDGLKTWLARSAPLRISLTCLASGGTSLYDVLEEIFHTSSRWRFLHYRQGPASQLPLTALSKLAETSLSALEELHLGNIEEGPLIITFPSSAVPRLQRVKVFIYTPTLQIHLPWKQLTHLSFSTAYADIAIEVLAECTNLIAASIIIPVVWADLPPPGQSAQTLSHLRYLALFTGGDDGHISPLFDRIFAPALETLEMDFSALDGRLTWPETSFTTFQLQSSHIVYLALNGCLYLTPENLCAALRHLPCVAELKLGHCYEIVGNNFMTMLVNKHGVAPLAPRLHNLVLKNVNRNAFAPNLFVDMLSSRWWTEADASVPRAVARWTRVELETRGDVSQDFTDTIQGLQDRGLPLEMLTIPLSVAANTLDINHSAINLQF
ncbi:hypothetical protein R3P38DRAFT_57991 [Favolaschia claudopus]|uniref:F-box domain-containing protein n=1 Tax=Favolaschia claudopus TaxID=2862362 RepID=A0AAW0EJ11_9AGAR